MTKVFIDTFKGSKVFSIWEVDEEGKKTAPAPVISCGVKKAQTLVVHKEALDQFLKLYQGHYEKGVKPERR